MKREREKDRGIQMKREREGDKREGKRAKKRQ